MPCAWGHCDLLGSAIAWIKKRQVKEIDARSQTPRCFVHHHEAFGLEAAGNGEPLKGLGSEHEVIRSLVQKDGLEKAVSFAAVSRGPRTMACTYVDTEWTA